MIVFGSDGFSQHSKAIEFRCEHLFNPIGIDAKQPRLSWMLTDKRTGAKQLAYQVLVATDSLQLLKGMGNMWQTSIVNSDANRVTYNGKPLQPFTKYYWKIQTWDKQNIRSNGSEIAFFETGMMDMKNWKGAWISDDGNISLKPAPYFRKTFSNTKKIKTARAYIAVAGLYELSVNGQKIGNHKLDPMYTRFDRRTLYVTYDVTSQLQDGINVVGVLLGNGWYNHQSTAVWNFHEAAWRGRPAFCMDLRIAYADGTSETIITDDQWKTSLSPVIFNSIYTAEHFDARLEQPGWNAAGFDESKWKQAIYRPAPSTNIVAQALQPIRNVEEIASKSIHAFNDTNYIFDLGRNIAGVSQLQVKGKAGTVIRLKHTERLYKNGHADMSNIDVHYRPTDDLDPFQTDIFILKGEGEETFMPRFNYKGFQYVEVNSSEPIQLTKESLKSYFMHSDVSPVGSITSSNTTINKIWEATNNSYLSNLFGYPTDCPQREKNGWTGDAHIAIETGLYSFDAITIYEKWMADHRDAQQPNGVLPSIIPTSNWGFAWGNGPDWTSTIAIIPWEIYLFYGDTKILADNYDNIKLYVDHINELSPSGLTSWGLGDWVPVKSKSPVELTSSAYYYTDAVILSKAAKLFNKQADHLRYTLLANKIKNAINEKYLNKVTRLYGDGIQTELAVPLYMGIVPDEVKAGVAANLAKRVAADSFHLDVGILGAKAILNALSENGYADVAYKVASQETYPSWGWWIKNGATTLYENWNIEAANDISLNHIMFGEIGAWLYKGLGGIKPDESQPGFKNVLLFPNFVEGLEFFKAEHKGPFGTIISNWKRSGNSVIYQVTVPPNATASIQFPNGKSVWLNGKIMSDIKSGNSIKPFKVKAGEYSFEIK
ncbi:MAG: family 78 glycoside hydrolase catalytic domain [Bacteroidota bacterium]